MFKSFQASCVIVDDEMVECTHRYQVNDYLLEFHRDNCSRDKTRIIVTASNNNGVVLNETYDSVQDAINMYDLYKDQIANNKFLLDNTKKKSKQLKGKSK